MSLPYQPLAEIKYSLSAADIHVVALGDPLVGIIHPCKIYGAMAVGRPVLYFGPKPSHVTDLLDADNFGMHVNHGDVDGAVAAILSLKEKSQPEREKMGQAAKDQLLKSLSQRDLSSRFCDAVEATLFNQRKLGRTC